MKRSNIEGDACAGDCLACCANKHGDFALVVPLTSVKVEAHIGSEDEYEFDE